MELRLFGDEIRRMEILRISKQVFFCFGIEEMYMVQDENAFEEQRFPKINSTAQSQIDVTRALAPGTRSWTTVCLAVPVPQHLWKNVSICKSLYEANPGSIGRPPENRPLQLTVHSCPDRISSLIHQHAGIISKPNNGTILPLQLLLHADHDGMPNISTTDLVREGGGARTFRRSGSLLLDDDDYPVT